MSFHQWIRSARSRTNGDARNPNFRQVGDSQPPMKMDNSNDNNTPPGPSNKSRRKSRKYFEELEQNRHSRVPPRSRSSSPGSASDYWLAGARRKPKAVPKRSEINIPDKKKRTAVYAIPSEAYLSNKNASSSVNTSNEHLPTDKGEAAAFCDMPSCSYASNNSSVKSNPSISENAQKIPEDYVNKEDKVDWLSRHITSLGNELHCVAAHVESLNRFYVNLCAYKDDFKLLRKKMNFWYEDPALLSLATPNSLLLTKGLYVAVACNNQKNPPGKEYHRGLILKVLRKYGDTKYKVFLIDSGNVTYASLNEIKYLKREYLIHFPAQAVECGVYLNSNYNNYAKRCFQWSAEEVNALRESLSQNIGINFIKIVGGKGKTYCKRGKRFLVSINILTGEEDLAIVVDRIEQRIIARLQGKYRKAIDIEDKNSDTTTQDEESCCNSVNSEEISWSSGTFSKNKDLSEESEMSEGKAMAEEITKTESHRSSTDTRTSKSVCSSISSENVGLYPYPVRPITKPTWEIKNVEAIEAWWQEKSPEIEKTDKVTENREIKKESKDTESESKLNMETIKDVKNKNPMQLCSKSVCNSISFEDLEIITSYPVPYIPIGQPTREIKNIKTIEPWWQVKSSEIPDSLHDSDIVKSFESSRDGGLDFSLCSRPPQEVKKIETVQPWCENAKITRESSNTTPTNRPKSPIDELLTSHYGSDKAKPFNSSRDTDFYFSVRISPLGVKEIAPIQPCYEHIKFITQQNPQTTPPKTPVSCLVKMQNSVHASDNAKSLKSSRNIDLDFSMCKRPPREVKKIETIKPWYENVRFITRESSNTTPTNRPKSSIYELLTSHYGSDKAKPLNSSRDTDFYFNVRRSPLGVKEIAPIQPCYEHIKFITQQNPQTTPPKTPVSCLVKMQNSLLASDNAKSLKSSRNMDLDFSMCKRPPREVKKIETIKPWYENVRFITRESLKTNPLATPESLIFSSDWV